MEEQLRSRPDPDTPPGHTMMPEGQRLEMLGSLKQSKRKRKEHSSSKIASLGAWACFLISCLLERCWGVPVIPALELCVQKEQSYGTVGPGTGLVQGT